MVSYNSILTMHSEKASTRQADTEVKYHGRGGINVLAHGEDFKSAGGPSTGGKVHSGRPSSGATRSLAWRFLSRASTAFLALPWFLRVKSGLGA